MHIHILAKVWEQKWDDCNTHSATKRNPCFHVTMHRGGADMESQVDINTCTDTCTHSKQGVGTEEE